MKLMKRKNTPSVVLAVAGIVSSVVSLPPVAGQPPTAAKTGGNAKAPQNPAGESDQEKLQGKWQIVSLDLGVLVVKREDKSAQWKETFEKEMFFQGDRHGQVGHSSSKFKLDETSNPKKITVSSDDGKLTFRGIYALEGDTLKLCMNGDGTSTLRPDEFETKKGSPVIITTLKKTATRK